MSIVRVERERAPDGERGRRQVPVHERNELRSRRGPRRVQQEGDVVGPRGTPVTGMPGRAVQREEAGPVIGLDRELDDVQTSIARHRTRGGVDARLDDHRPGREIRQRELELVGSQTRVERRARGRAGDREERRGHRRTVPHHQRDPIVAGDAHGAQLAGRGLDVRYEGTEVDRVASRCRERDPVGREGRCAFEQRGNRIDGVRG